VLHARLSSRTAMALGFAGGLMLGRRQRARSARSGAPAAKTRVRAAARRVKQSLPPHWLGNYLLWPLVLASARDFVVTHRPSRGGEA